MIIYLVSTGSHSDYMPVALFSTHEQAEEFNNQLGYSANEIEEFTLDPEVVFPTKSQYAIEMKRDGTVIRRLKLANIAASGQDKNTFVPKLLPIDFHLQIYEDVVSCLFVRCQANDEIHAIKITNEIRTLCEQLNLWDSLTWGSHSHLYSLHKSEIEKIFREKFEEPPFLS